jgi:hypothetical protein
MSAIGPYRRPAEPSTQLLQGSEAVLHVLEGPWLLALRQILQQFGRPGVGLSQATPDNAGNEHRVSYPKKRSTKRRDDLRSNVAGGGHLLEDLFDFRQCDFLVYKLAGRHAFLDHHRHQRRKIMDGHAMRAE